MNRNPKWLWLASAVILASGAAAPAFAHEQEQKVIIMTERHHADGEAHATVERRGARVIVAECGGDRTDISGGSEAEGDKARIVICNRGNVSSADRARRLEHVLERINSDTELSAETRAKITTALREAIDKLNATR
jgi:hypothetical protein